jgi:hypothetical protein
VELTQSRVAVVYKGEAAFASDCTYVNVTRNVYPILSDLVTSLTVIRKTQYSGNSQYERRNNRYSDTVPYLIGYFRHTGFSAIQGGMLH